MRAVGEDERVRSVGMHAHGDGICLKVEGRSCGTGCSRAGRGCTRDPFNVEYTHIHVGLVSTPSSFGHLVS